LKQNAFWGRTGWFAVMLKNNKYVDMAKNYIEAWAKQKNLDNIYEVFAPYYLVKDRDPYDNPRNKQEQLYPKIIFVHMNLNPDTYSVVKSCPYVMYILKKNNPVPLTDKEVEALKQARDETKPAIKIIFTEGDKVRVSRGPFEGFKGTVVHQKADGTVEIMILVFGRETILNLAVVDAERLT